MLAACTIREDRSPCPCLLTVDFTRIHKLDNYADQFRLDVTTFHKWNSFEDFSFESLPDKFEIQVPKDTFFVLSMHGTGSQFKKYPYYRIEIEYGDEMEPISTGVDSLYCNWEFCYSDAKLWKNYCEITFILGDTMDRTLSDYAVEVKGGICGVSLMHNEPIEGPFSCRKTFKGDRMILRVPRQSGTSLEATLYREGVVMTQIALGKLLAENNYSWGDQVLRDVELTVGYNKLSGTITIEKWNYGGTIRDEI